MDTENITAKSSQKPSKCDGQKEASPAGTQGIVKKKGRPPSKNNLFSVTERFLSNSPLLLGVFSTESKAIKYLNKLEPDTLSIHSDAYQKIYQKPGEEEIRTFVIEPIIINKPIFEVYD